MTFSLASAPARFAIVLFSGALAACLGFFALRNALAAYYRDLDTRSGYEHAVRLESANSRNWYLLGRSYLYDLEQPDTLHAIDSLRKAVSLDPYSAEARLDLAAAYDGESDVARAREEFLAAQRVYPLSADVCWSYGNFLLRQGELEPAYGQIRKAVHLEPKRSAEAFSRMQQVQPDATILLDRALPSAPEVYLPILQSLASAGDLQNAELVWQRLLALHTPVNMRDMVSLVDEFIHQRRSGEAMRVWQQAVSIMLNPPPPDPPGSLLWDGGFESGYAGGGFSWHFVPANRNVQISFDPSQKHSGSQSLRLLFNGHQNLDFTDACHNINPQPGQRYLLTAWIKTQSLTSSEGLRLQIFVFTATSNESVSTEEVHGTQEWRRVQLDWTAPPTAGFGTVCAKRYMSDQPGSSIQGAAWIDDVSLTPLNGVPAQP